ncbi:MAG TPA: hypothetical protein VIK53_05495 [Verrucomicrobiae bacterium]
MLCEIQYKPQPTEGTAADAKLQDHGGSYRVCKIAGRADHIHQFLRNQKDVIATKIIVRETESV